MLSALSQSPIAASNNNNSNDNQSSQSRSQSPTKKSSSALKLEPELDIRRINELQEGQQRSSYGGSGDAEGESCSTSNYDNSRMDYANDDSVHPLAPAPHPHPSESSSSRRNSSVHPTPSSSVGQNNYYTSSPVIQPQQHQQLLKLKTEHGFSSAPVSVPESNAMAHNSNEDVDERSTGSSRRGPSSEVNMIGPGSESMRDDRDEQENEDDEDEDDDDNDLDERDHRLAVDTSSPSTRHDGTSTLVGTPETASLNTDTPTTSSGTTAPSSRRGSLRAVTATLPRSALQEETIALFKQYRNLIPCAKCFCRNTIQRDGMSDGNLRFKCRPPVAMSLICNKSYSESKIRNMIAGVVYGHSLPDSNGSGSATSPGENVLALAPPPMPKSSRRASTKNDGSPRLGAEITSERLQRLKEDPEEQGSVNPLQMERDPEERMSSHQHLMDSRRPSQPHPHQGPISRRASVQQLRRPSVVEDEGMMMDYEDSLPSGQHSTYLQVPGTPPMEGEDSRHYRSRTSYNQPPRSVTPTGPSHPSSGGPLPVAAGRQGGQKLHHSHSHPNIGQQRHQQYLEQQEREHRGSFSGQGHVGNHSSSSQSLSQQQRLLQRPLAKRESIQHLGGGPERRSSQPSPNPESKYLSGPGSVHEAHSPAMISSPRSSPGREMGSHHHSYGSSNHEPSGTPTMRSLPGSVWYEESNHGYFSRRMSQPHPSYGYGGSHSGLPPTMPSPLVHSYDRRASEAEEYPPVHREKYEKLNASTLLAPGPNNSPSGSSSSLPRHPLQRMKPLAHPVSPNSAFESRQHPLDPAEPEPMEESGTRQSQASYLRSGSSGNNPNNTGPSSPWLGSSNGSGGNSNNNGSSTPQSEPMRYSHSMGNSATNSNSNSGSYGPSGPRPSLRHQSSLSNIYYQSPRLDDRDRFEPENEMDMSPDYHEVDADGRPIARMRHQSLKRKSLGQPLGRSNSHQNLYSTNMQHSYSHQSQHHSQQHSQHRDSHSQHGTPHHQNQHPYYHHSAHDHPSHQGHHHYHQHPRHSHHQQHQDLNAALPPPPNNNMGIKMTCFPSPHSKTSPTTKTIDTSEHSALPLSSQCSKIVIEIYQPRNAQAYSSAISLPSSSTPSSTQHQQPESGNKEVSGAVDQLRKSNAQHLARSSSSIIGHRRSASRDLVSYGACKKRRADSVDENDGTNLARSEKDTVVEEDEDQLQQDEEGVESNDGNKDELQGEEKASSLAAAAVMAAATAAQVNKRSRDVSVEEQDDIAKQQSTEGSDAVSAVQVFGIDYLAQHQPANKKHSSGLLGLGLGIPSSSASTVDRAVDALQVAKASSYVVLEDQKEMGVDYSLFTRVETAGWRILIPPNVVASFRSEDFGLMLKPKGHTDVDLRADENSQQQQQQRMQQEREKVARVVNVKEARRSIDEEEEEQEQDDNDDAVEEVEEEEEYVRSDEANNEDEDVGTEGVRRIALRDDDPRVDETVAMKSVSYYHHPAHSYQHQQQSHHTNAAHDLEMQGHGESEEAVETAVNEKATVETHQQQSQEQGAAKHNRIVEGDIEMDRE